MKIKFRPNLTGPRGSTRGSGPSRTPRGTVQGSQHQDDNVESVSGEEAGKGSNKPPCQLPEQSQTEHAQKEKSKIVEEPNGSDADGKDCSVRDNQTRTNYSPPEDALASVYPELLNNTHSQERRLTGEHNVPVVQNRAQTLQSGNGTGDCTISVMEISQSTAGRSDGEIREPSPSEVKSNEGREKQSRSRTGSVSPGVVREKEPGKTTISKKKRQRTSRDPTPDTSGEVVEDVSPSPKKLRTSTRIREAPNRSVMTMQELIYYNPTANPMSSKSLSKSVPSVPDQTTSPLKEREVTCEDKGNEEGEDERIVPKLRIGADGNIVIDEESMLMETTPRHDLPGDVSEIMEGPGHTTSASYRNRHKITKWSKQETSKFFKALSQVGTDFTMMTLLLPSRSRKELKNKFKKEEKSNSYLISLALKNQQIRTQTT